MRQPRSRSAGHRDHAPTVGEQPRQSLLRRRGHVDAASQHLLGCALDHQQPADGVVDEDGGCPAGVIKRQRRHTRNADYAGPAVPQRGVELIRAHSAGRQLDVGGQLTRTQHRFRVVTCGVDGVDEFDAALGQGARFVGDQDVDVTQILNAHQALHKNLQAR